MGEVRIDFDEPSSGYIEVTLRVGDEEIGSTPEHMVDCLTTLVYAGLELLEPRPVRPVLLLEGAPAYRWSFSGDGDVVDLRVTFHRSLALALADRDGILELSGSANRVVFARAIWTAFRRLEGAVGRERIEAGWKERLPVKEIAQLGARLAELPVEANHSADSSSRDRRLRKIRTRK